MPSIIDLSYGTLLGLSFIFTILSIVFVVLFNKSDYDTIKDENGKPKLSKNGEIQTKMSGKQLIYAILMFAMAIFAFVFDIAYLVK